VRGHGELAARRIQQNADGSGRFLAQLVHELSACLQLALADEVLPNRALQLLERAALGAILVGLEELADLGLCRVRGASGDFLLQVLLCRSSGCLGSFLDERIPNHLVEHVPPILIDELRHPRLFGRVHLQPLGVQLLERDRPPSNLGDHLVGRGVSRRRRRLRCTLSA
jgi:hypothetical protein